MKKLILSLIALITLPTATFAQDFNTIVKDKIFQDYLKELVAEKNLPKDITTIRAYNADGVISNAESENMYKILGYKTNDEYIASLTRQVGRLKTLEGKYRLSTLSVTNMALLLDQGFTEIRVPLTPPGENTTSVDNCARRYNNCVVIVTATAILGHVACIPADVTILGGILCHGAVVAAQYAMLDNCQLDYQDCVAK